MALDGALNRESCSSSMLLPRAIVVTRRGGRRKEVLRPSSGSSVPARRVRRSEVFLPWSSGSSVTPRRVRATTRDDFRPGVPASPPKALGAYLGLGTDGAVKLKVARFSSLVARGLTLFSTLGTGSSGLEVSRRGAPVKTLMGGGLLSCSCSFGFTVSRGSGFGC